MATTTTDAAGSDPIENWLANGAGTEKVRITSAGRVGIGNTSPANLLHVEGGSAAYPASSGSAVPNGTVRIGDTTDAKLDIGLNGANGAWFQVANRTAYNNTYPILLNPNGGTVGIGTTAPAAQLHIKSDGSSLNQLRIENSQTGGRVWAISGGIDAAADLTFQNQTNGNTIVSLWNDSTNNLRALRLGAASGSQGSGVDTILIGQSSGVGSGRDATAVYMQASYLEPAHCHLGSQFRNNANTSYFTGATITLRRISGQDKSSMSLYTYNGTAAVEAIFLDQNGNVGIGTNSPSNPMDTGSNASGAKLTAAGNWTNGCSRKYKTDIQSLKLDSAIETLMALDPVTYKSTCDPDEKHVGFIAEDVPELVATKDRKGLSPMDIVAVLAKVVQAQQKKLDELTACLARG